MRHALQKTQFSETLAIAPSALSSAHRLTAKRRTPFSPRAHYKLSIWCWAPRYSRWPRPHELGELHDLYDRAAAGCEYGAPSQPIGEHLLVVPVPIALEHLGRIVAPLEAQKLGHLRVARLDLPAGCPSVVGEKVAAGKFDCAIDQPAEVIGGLAPAVPVVIHMQVHDGADPRLARPGEEALVVLLDEADRSVDELRTVVAQIRPHGGKERGERGARHIELADHFRAFHLGL